MRALAGDALLLLVLPVAATRNPRSTAAVAQRAAKHRMWTLQDEGTGDVSGRRYQARTESRRGSPGPQSAQPIAQGLRVHP